MNFNFRIENLRHSACHHADDTYIQAVSSHTRYGMRMAIHRHTGITGKLRDRGRFFITTGARDFLALLLGKSSIARYKECNPEIFWARAGGAAMRWCAGVIRRQQQSRTEEMEEMMGRTFIAPGVKDIVRKMKKLV